MGLCNVTWAADEVGTAQASSVVVHADGKAHATTITAPGVNAPITELKPEDDAAPAASVTMTGKIEQDRKRGMRGRDHDYDQDNN